VAEVVTGTTPPTNHPDYYGNSVPFVGPADLGKSEPIIQSSKWLSDKGAKQARLLPADTVLVCCIGATIGKVGFSGTELVTNQQINALVFDQNVIFPRYAFHYCRTLREIFRHYGASTTLPILPKGRFQELEIPVPPIAEQKRIAAILDKAEELRSLRRKALVELDAIVQSIFLEMFGDPEINPKGWLTGKLQDITDFQTGYPFSSFKYTTEGEAIKLCRGANVLPGRIDWSDLASWSKAHTEAVSNFALQSGDVVMAMDRPWISEGFKIAQIRQADLPAFLVQRVARLRGKNSDSNPFIFQLLKHPAFTRHCKPTETTIPHISPGDIKTFTFPIPPLSLQQEFAQRVEAIDRLKATQRQSLAQLDTLFASLQHRAFQGEL